MRVRGRGGDRGKGVRGGKGRGGGEDDGMMIRGVEKVGW